MPDSIKPVNPKALKTSDIRKILEDRTLHNQYQQKTAVKKEYELLANRLTAALAMENNKKERLEDLAILAFYHSDKNVDSALFYADRIISESKKDTLYSTYLIVALLNKSGLFMNNGQLEVAIPLLNHALAQSRRQQTPESIVGLIYLLLAQVNTKVGFPEKAITFDNQAIICYRNISAQEHMNTLQLHKAMNDIYQYQQSHRSAHADSATRILHQLLAKIPDSFKHEKH